MTRVISLFLPSWSTDRLRTSGAGQSLSPDRPLAIVGHDGKRRAVAALDGRAYGAGLRIGMAATKAQVLVPDVQIVKADPAADRGALEKLALWALRRYAPIVAVDGADGIVIDSTGAAHLHGGEDAMLADLTARVKASGVEARASIADSWGAAHALARFGGRRHVNAAPRAQRHLMANLPIAALRLPAPVVTGLHTLGFVKVADLLDQPRAPLTVRFGAPARPGFGRRARADRADPRRRCDRSEAVLRRADRRRRNDRPLTDKLSEKLCAVLAEKGLGALRLDLLCQRVDSRAQVVRIGMAQPVRDAKRIARLLREKIETIEPGFGIEIMTLAAVMAQKLEHTQSVNSLIEDSGPDVADIVDTLSNRIGEARIYRAAPVASDVPERSVARIAALAPDSGASWSGRWPRPPRLMTPPEPIEAIALLPDNPPVAFMWRGVRRRVRRADGPERVFGEWWEADAETQAVRDYFRVEDDAGERYWIFRAGDGEDPATGSQRWFLHGVFG